MKGALTGGVLVVSRLPHGLPLPAQLAISIASLTVLALHGYDRHATLALTPHHTGTDTLTR